MAHLVSKILKEMLLVTDIKNVLDGCKLQTILLVLINVHEISRPFFPQVNMIKIMHIKALETKCKVLICLSVNT